MKRAAFHYSYTHTKFGPTYVITQFLQSSIQFDAVHYEISICYWFEKTKSTRTKMWCTTSNSETWNSDMLQNYMIYFIQSKKAIRQQKCSIHYSTIIQLKHKRNINEYICQKIVQSHANIKITLDHQIV